MDSSEEDLCTSCGKNPARHRLCVVKQGGSATQDLCDACFDAEAPQEWKDENTAIKAASCSYCGANAAVRAGTMDAIIGREVDRFACHSCFQEHHRFLLARLHGMEAGLVEEEASFQIEALRQLSEETESHMRDWVRQRDN